MKDNPIIKSGFSSSVILSLLLVVGSSAALLIFLLNRGVRFFPDSPKNAQVATDIQQSPLPKKRFADPLKDQSSTEEFCDYVKSEVEQALSRLNGWKASFQSCRAESPDPQSPYYYKAALVYDVNRRVSKADAAQLNESFESIGYGSLRIYYKDKAYFFDFEKSIFVGVRGSFGDDFLTILAERKYDR